MGANLGTIAKPLSEDYQVYSLDLRNHGRSFHSDSMQFSDMADDVARLMDHCGLASARILGHSLGGKVAMQLALQQPSRVEKLIVADIAPVSYGSHHTRVFDALRAVDLSVLTRRADAEVILKQYVEDMGTRNFLLKNLYRNDEGMFAWRMNVPALEHGYDDIKDGIDSPTPFTGPTLFIKGELSHYIEEQHREKIERLFTHVQLKVIQGTGHWLHAEKPDIFNNITKRFFAQ
jgi:esterase